MKKPWLILILFSLLIPVGAQAASKVYIYRQANNPANYVKFDKVKKSEVEELNLNHPYQFTEVDMANILRSLRYSRRALFSDKIKQRNVFEEEYVEKYTPLLVEAFAKATPKKAVFMSVAQKRPWVIVRNDHLTQIRLWVTGNELHIKFVKTEAKLFGDYQANTPAGRKQIKDAKGLRISLDPQEGQKFAFDSNQELVLDLSTNWEKVVAKLEAEDEQSKAAKKAEKEKKKQKKYTSNTATSTQPVSQPVSAKDQKTAMDRLSELKKLKEKGLITEDDYNKKKDEILQGM